MKSFFKLLINCFIFSSLSSPFTALESLAFPIYAQQNYENPREANGKIVCANCHLAQKSVELESPKSILPNTIFEALVKIPLKKDSKQILSNGNTGELNIGAVLILPEEFKLAPKNRLTEKLQAELKNVYITPYSSKYENILVVGPISAKKSNEIIFPILSPDPESNKKTHYLKYPIYLGANRGRGQLYPNGEKTNNNIVTSSIAGKVSKINFLEKNTEIQILDKNGNLVNQLIPKNIQIIVKENQPIAQDQALTINPNVGGFGQTESEIVLQKSERIYFYTVFCLLIILTQSIFVLKKKQFEKVQLAEMDF